MNRSFTIGVSMRLWSPRLTDNVSLQVFVWSLRLLRLAEHLRSEVDLTSISSIPMSGTSSSQYMESE